MTPSPEASARRPVIAGRGAVSAGHPLAASAALQQLTMTPDYFATMRISSSASAVDPAGVRILYKPEETPVTLAAKRSFLGRVYLDWAQYPITETQRMESGYIVHFKDLRYDYPGRSARATLSGMVLLNRDLQVLDERFGMGSRHQGKNTE